MGQMSGFLLGCHLGLKNRGWGIASVRDTTFPQRSGLQCHTDTQHPAGLCPQGLGAGYEFFQRWGLMIPTWLAATGLFKTGVVMGSASALAVSQTCGESAWSFFHSSLFAFCW